MKEKVCPRCGNTYTEYSALSRKDNKTEICPTCGQAESLLSMLRQEDKNWATPIESNVDNIL